MKKKELIEKKHLYRFIFLILLLFSGLTMNAQEKLSLHFTNITLEEAIKKIEASSKYTFFYDNKKTDLSQKVSINAANETIESILATMLKPTNLGFVIENRQIALISKNKTSEEKKTFRITGTVKDEKGESIIGASVAVRNSTIGTLTDLDGGFSIDVPENSIIDVSFLGFIKQEITATRNQSFNIVLVENTTLLGDVVVIGYGSVKKSDATGAVDVIKSSDFNKGVASSPESLFNGHIAGVQVTPGSGQPGAKTSVRIRGVNSVTASSEPLYVIDGVPIDNTRSAVGLDGDAGLSNMTMNPLSMIAASDIESMTVLKDASATAIYGSRGANGVIIVTTKGGKEGVTSINYSSSVGFSNVSKKMDVLSADQYRQYVSGVTRTTSTDWQDEIFRTALVQDHNVTFSSGNKNTSYRASVSASNQDGIIISTGLDRYTLRFNASHKMFDDRLIFNVNANNTYYKFDNILEQQTGGANGGIINNALKADPTQPVYNEDGTFNEYSKVSVRNPVAMAKQITDKTKGDRFIGNADATFFFLPQVLSAKVNFGYDVDNIYRKAYQPRTSVVAEGVEGRALTENNRYSNYLFESYVTFDKTFNKIHHVNVIGGYSWQEFDNNTSSVRAEGFVNDNLGANNVGGARNQDARNDREKNRLISFYGRVNYTLFDTYLLTATIRRDGSSRFGTNNRWGTFPSAALAWKIKEEAFMKDADFVSDLKVRLGYGVTGNQDIGNFRYSQTYAINVKQGTEFGGIFYPGYNITGIANPNLKWEETAQLNFGIDYSLLRNRIRGSIDLYHKKTSNLLLTIDAIQPAVSSTYLDNIGEMTNKGIEFTINASVIDTKDFNWNTNFNIAYNKNEVTKLYNGKDIIYGKVSGAGAYGNTQILRVGESIGSFYGYNYLGLENGEEIFDASNERVITGSALPKYVIGFTNSFAYKDFDLSFVLRSNIGNDVYNNTRAELSQGNRLPGQNTNLEGAEFHKAGGGGIVYPSSRWVENASFLKLDNLTLGYNFVFAPKIVKSARVYVTAQNLFTITKYKGYDPEVNNMSDDKGVQSIGIDYCSYPHSRTFLVGLNVNF